MGDPTGIGPEVIAKAFRSDPLAKGKTHYLVIGDKKIFKKYAPKLRKDMSFLDIENAFPKIKIGTPTQDSARLSLLFLDKAIELLKHNDISALVTAPVCKEAINGLGVSFRGHTEYLAEAFHIKRYDMMFVTPKLKTIIVTRHIPIDQVSKALSIKKILDTIELTDQVLRKDFRIKSPRIGVCGLNPHAGEGGLMGKEEATKIIPAIKKARQKGINVTGPLSGDTAFYARKAEGFDTIIAMYHDQGLIPVKTLAFNQAVNLTIGLPFIRTSPAHGTAFDIAGKNKADASSMREAIQLASVLS